MTFPAPDMSLGVDTSAANTTRWPKATRIQPSDHLLSGAVQPGDRATLDGRYRLVTLLKTGGMGEIYAAEHIHTHRRVAVKILREPWCRDRVTHERFRREAQGTSRIIHEHVVEILDFGVSAEGTRYLVMELLYGEDLQTTLRRERRLPLRRAANILLQVCAGLGAAHEAGIVHRDLKPGNCFRAGFHGVEDFIKLVDFGIAKRLPIEESSDDPPLTTAGSVLGTIFYMPPEQASGGQIDHRADIYAAGVLFYQLVCGRLPFRGRSLDETFRLILVEDPPSIRSVAPELELPVILETLLRRALAKSPESRFQSMAELAAAISALLRSLSQPGASTARERPPVLAAHSQRRPDAPGVTRWLTLLSIAALAIMAVVRCDPSMSALSGHAPAVVTKN
jgi:serine/threonine protein kinase